MCRIHPITARRLMFPAEPRCRGPLMLAAMFLVVAVAYLPASGQEAAVDRREIDTDFRERLEQLAEKCDELELEKQAAVTRGWFIERDPGRQYLFLPFATDSSKPPDGAAKAVKYWHEHFLRIRRGQAEKLFELARRALEAHQPQTSYQLLHEVLREDPGHKETRRILGLGTTTRGRPPTARPLRIVHPDYRWSSGKHWRVVSNHFQISTNHSDREGIELAERLEQVYSIWKQVFFRYWSDEDALAYWYERGGPTGRSSKNKHRVVLFKERGEYVAAVSKRDRKYAISDGIYLYGDKMSLFHADESTAVPTWIHETTHQLFQEIGDRDKNVGAKDNFWIIEGVALYMESLTERDGYFTLGGFDARRLQYARHASNSLGQYVPLAELVKLGREDVLKKQDEIQRLYGQAAGLAHFLMDDQQAKYREALLEYLQLLYSGRERADSLTKITGVELNELDRQYGNYLNVRDQQLLRYLTPPPHVQVLLLGGTDVTDAGMAALQKHTDLEILSLANTKVTDQGLANLSHLKKLNTLLLAGTKVSDAGLRHLTGLKQLQVLDLQATRVTEAGRRALEKNLPNLEE